MDNEDSWEVKMGNQMADWPLDVPAETYVGILQAASELRLIEYKGLLGRCYEKLLMASDGYETIDDNFLEQVLRASQ